MKIKPHIYTEAVPELLMPKGQTITKRRKKYLSFHPLFLIFRSSFFIPHFHSSFFIFSFSLFILNSYGQSSNQNYVKSITYKRPSTQGGIDLNNPAHVMTEVTYIDGLGRPIQQVAHKQSGDGKDIITHIEYDQFGRQPKEYLPYEANATAMLFDSNALTNTLNFYYTQYYENTTNPYSEKLFEKSPLNRVQEQAAPGNAWSLANGHTIKFGYNTNENGEVKRFYANTTGMEDGAYKATLSMSGHYAPNQLYKTTITDENGAETIEYKDKEGRVVLKRTFNNHWVHDTYYVYDIYGNLTYVIPPNAVDMGTITQTVLDNLCYQYRYDYRNRLVEKRLPGKEIWEYIVYDKLDRVVATGPALSPFEDHLSGEEGWLLTKYDAFGRVAYTGWKEAESFSSEKRNEFQQEMDGLTQLFVKKLATDILIDNIQVRYSNDVYPTTFKLLTVNYYDNYNYPGTVSIPKSVEGQLVTTAVKGLATGSWVRVLTGSGAALNETGYVLYDKKARPIRTHTKNHLDGYTQTDTKLDFTGAMPEYTITRHKRIPDDDEIAVREDFEYTPQSRLQKHSHKINNQNTEMLSFNFYDALGNLVIKDVGNVYGYPLQIVNYKYNIRGWLTDINNIESLGNDLFAFKLDYNSLFAGTPLTMNQYPALFNGNIRQTTWRTSTDNQIRSYRYKYDELNRLNEANYNKITYSSIQQQYLANPTNSYNEHLSYDQNGNIVTLTRNGDLDSDTSVIAIDNLLYDYDDRDRLKNVIDFTANPSGFKEGVYLGDAFIYDKYGNLIEDKNKGFRGVTYNHLNLPKKMTFGSNKHITYLYNALGQKLLKQVTDNTTTITTEYQSGFHYENYGLKFFATAEGYVNVTTRGYNYVYNYTDHLGNIRLSYTKNTLAGNPPVIVEENNYYPFGLKHQGYNNISPPNNVYKYKFNGKELQDELGLNVYDFGARNYMPDLGRWANIDPLAEQSRRWTPYNYAYNNPVYFIDPDGMQAMSTGYGSVDFETSNIAISFTSFKDIGKNKKGGEFSVSQKGKITKLNSNEHYENDTQVDILMYGKPKYNKKDELQTPHIKIKTGVLDNIVESSRGTFIHFKESGDDAEKFFKFVADYTRVEWSFYELQIAGKKDFRIYTSHDEYKETYGSSLGPGFAGGGVLVKHKHNQPLLVDVMLDISNDKSSGADRNFRNKLNEEYDRYKEDNPTHTPRKLIFQIYSNKKTIDY